MKFNNSNARKEDSLKTKDQKLSQSHSFTVSQHHTNIKLLNFSIVSANLCEPQRLRVELINGNLKDQTFLNAKAQWNAEIRKEDSLVDKD